MSFLEKAGNAVDGAISVVSPIYAARRQAARYAVRMGSSYFQGAKSGRLTNNWATGQESVDSSIYSELQTLRDRSRDLNRNNPVAAGITDTICSNAIHTGIRPQSRINADALNLSPEQAAVFQKQAERVWTKWSGNCDARGKLTFAEIEFLAVRQILEAGEFLSVRRAIDDGRPYFLALDIMEPDRLDDPPDKRSDAKTRFGITSDDRGKPLIYHIRKTHPGDSFRKRDDAYKFTAVKAHDTAGRPNVFHVFPILRPGQTRGIPFFAPVVEKFKMLADYLEAELVAARVAACFAAFVKTENPYGAATGSAATTQDGQRLEALEPGVIEYLGMNQDVTFAKPERPGTTFDQFVARILRMIGAALGLPYELVLKDFSQTNYSSARAALLQAYRVFQVWQQMIINHLCQPVYELLLEEAWLRGELAAPGFESQKWEFTRAAWIPPGWKWVDPKREAEADKISIEMGLKTRADSCAEQGQDWEEKAEQAAREKQKYEELGLPWEGMNNKGGGGQAENAISE